MTSVPLGHGAFKRTYAQEPEIFLLNRLLEKNTSNQVEQVSLIARPGDKQLVSIGSGQVRVMDHQPGAFNGDLFFVINDTLYRWAGAPALPIALGGTIAGTGTPSITFVVGAGYEHLFIADGTLLQYYDGEAAASGTLTAAGAIVAGDTVTVDLAYYEWTAGSVDAGAPAGTLADPYLVALGGSNTDALANLLKALNLTGTAGTDYSTATQINVNVAGFSSDTTKLSVKARVRGVAGNSIATTETGANISWGAVTLEGGGSQALNGIVTPDDVAMVSLDTLSSFAICVVAKSKRFYWIRPGEVVIDALDFAEVESEPDEIIQVLRIGDQLWFFGQTSTEVWYATGTLDIAESQFAPQRGLAFSQGVIEGTAVQIRTHVILVAEDQIVYKVVGGVQRLSTNGIEERIRLAQTALEGS